MGGKAKKEKAETYDFTKGQSERFDTLAQTGAARNMQDYDRLMGGFQNFIDTGGFSDQNLSDMRNRPASVGRSVYANAERELDRNRALQGGYSPNFAPAQAKMAREQSQLQSDMSRDTEAGIAQMVQRGKLSGLSGSTSLYGSTPGMASTFGNLALGAGSNRIGALDQMGKGGFDWAGLGSSLLGAAMPLFPFGPGKKGKDDAKKPEAPPATTGSGGQPNAMPIPQFGLPPEQPVIPSAGGYPGSGYPAPISSPTPTPNVTTDFELPPQQLPGTPSTPGGGTYPGGFGQVPPGTSGGGAYPAVVTSGGEVAEHLPGTFPPIYMSPSGVFYDEYGNIVGDGM